MDGDLDCAFANAKSRAASAWETLSESPTSHGFERFELAGLACGFIFLRQHSQGAVEQRQRPFTVKFPIRAEG